MYIWEQVDWPVFTWEQSHLPRLVATVSREQGRLLGRMGALGFDLRTEAHLQTLTLDVLKSSEIEGEVLDTSQVRSLIAKRLGIEVAIAKSIDRDVDGVVEMMLDATINCATPLTPERLFAWQAALFPADRSEMREIKVRSWRDDDDGPMQIVSGAIGKEHAHFEAPPAAQVPAQMKAFLSWFEGSPEIDPLLIAALAHLWFVTIHPFEDGNGRIARTIADLALARCEKSQQRFYSMSAQIRAERNVYYSTLEETQKGSLDITLWTTWFLECLLRAIDGAQEALDSVLVKARFWERFAKEPLNGRQIKVLNTLLDDFEGKLTSSKWAKIAKCSQDTAYRDIQDLIERSALVKDAGGGRSTSYSLNPT